MSVSASLKIFSKNLNFLMKSLFNIIFPLKGRSINLFNEFKMLFKQLNIKDINDVTSTADNYFKTSSICLRVKTVIPLKKKKKIIKSY